MILSWVAFSCTLSGLLLNGRKNIACWPVWLIGDLLWIGCYLPKHDWPIVVTNSVFLGINVLGWYQWRKPCPPNA